MAAVSQPLRTATTGNNAEEGRFVRAQYKVLVEGQLPQPTKERQRNSVFLTNLQKGVYSKGFRNIIANVDLYIIPAHNITFYTANQHNPAPQRERERQTQNERERKQRTHSWRVDHDP